MENIFVSIKSKDTDYFHNNHVANNQFVGRLINEACMLVFLKIKERLKRNQFIMKWFHKMQTHAKMALYLVSPTLLVKFRFKYIRNKWPDLKNPKSFDEKLLWLMLYWRHPLKSICADKYAMRTYVKKQGLANILPVLLGVYEKSSDIDFSALPERFVLKCTHGWGFNIICRDKNNLDVQETKNKLDTWLKTDVRKWAGEIHYSIRPRIICEEFLDDLTGDMPRDYKVYCFDGKAYCTMVCTERGTGNTKFDFYDRTWNNKLPYDKISVLDTRDIPKPDAYGAIITAAEKLAKPFPFVRVDFYSIKGNAVLSEMTFTPNACIDTELTDEAQCVLSKMLILPGEKILK